MVTNFSCVCGGGLGDLGVPSCVKTFGLSVRDIFMNTFAKDGTRNSIKFSDLDSEGVLPAAFLLGKFNDPDPTKRWYITPDQYEEQTPARTEKQQQTSGTGTIKNLRNGVKTFAAELWDVPDSWAASINKGSCNEMSVFKVDEPGSMAGEVSSDGSEFFPLRIQKKTLNAEPFDAVPGKDGYTAVTYQLSRSVQEGNLLTLASSQFGESLLDAKSLIGMVLSQGVTANTATELYVDAKSVPNGTYGKPFYLVGYTLPTDWSITDSSMANVVPVSVEELEDGKYKYTLPPAVPAGEIKVAFVKERTSITEEGYSTEEITLTKP